MKKIMCILLATAMLLVGCSAPSLAEAEAVVLVDDDFVKVSFIEISDATGLSSACHLRLHVENKADHQISVYLEDAYVNDMAVMMMSGIPMDIAPGKMSQNPFVFSGFTKDEVDKVEFKIHVYDEHMKDVETTDVVTITVK